MEIGLNRAFIAFLLLSGLSCCVIGSSTARRVTQEVPNTVDFNTGCQTDERPRISEPVTHTCQLVLVMANGTLTEFRVRCSASKPELHAPVRARLGQSLAAHVQHGTGQLEGVAWDAAGIRLSEMDFSSCYATNGQEYNDPLEDWGIDLLDVPHLQLVDSVVLGAPLSHIAPLVQCLNCSYITARNVTLENLVAPRFCFGISPYGATRLSGLRSGSFESVRCSRVQGARGSACLLITTAGRGANVTISNSQFLNNFMPNSPTALTASQNGYPIESTFYPSRRLGEEAIPPPLIDMNMGNLSPGQPTNYSDKDLHTSQLTCPDDTSWGQPSGSTTDDNSNFKYFGAVLVVCPTSPIRSSTPNVSRSGGQVIVYNSIFNGNSADCGAGISVVNMGNGARLVLVNSTVVNNNASLDGGGVIFQEFVPGAAHLVLSCNSQVSGNGAWRNGGGVAFRANSAGNVYLNNSNMLGNWAGDSGGAMHVNIVADIGHLTIHGSDIIGNLANHSTTGCGGGVYIRSESQIEGLSVTGGSKVTGNSAGSTGGALYLEARSSTSTLVTLSSSSLLGNIAGNYGGAMYASMRDMKSINVLDSATLDSNEAMNGGAIYVDISGGRANVSVIGSSLIKNKAACSGGALYIRALSSKTQDSVLISGGSSLVGNGAGKSGVRCSDGARNGGALFINSSGGMGNITITDSSYLTDNIAMGSGGAIYADGLEVLSIYNKTEMSGNEAGLHGGFVSLTNVKNDKSPVRIMLDSVTATGNRADGSGGFLHCAATNQMYSVHLRTNGSTSISNSSVGFGDGGAICIESVAELTVVIDGATRIIHCQTSGSSSTGGAMRLQANNMSVSITGGSSIMGNQAYQYGGGIHAAAREMLFMVDGRSMVIGNQADIGGGIHIEVDDGGVLVNVTGASKFHDNRATSYGGAMNLRTLQRTADVKVSVAWEGGSTLMNNTAGISGGGIRAEADSPVYVFLNRSEWTSNSAGSEGGALSVSHNQDLRKAPVSIRLLGGTINNNRANGSSGGALHVDGYVNFVSDEHSQFVNNTAKFHGGFMFMTHLPTQLTVDSCHVANNTSLLGSGGAFSIALAGSINMNQCTKCASDGGASNISISRSFLSGNTAQAEGGVLALTTEDNCCSVPLFLKVVESLVLDNFAGGAGGAISLINVAKDVAMETTLQSSLFRHNTAGNTRSFSGSANYGGALFLWYQQVSEDWRDRTCMMSAQSVIFDSNTCHGGSGGAAMLIYCNVHLQNCTFTHNSASLSGGAIMSLHKPRRSLEFGLTSVSTPANLSQTQGALYSRRELHETAMYEKLRYEPHHIVSMDWKAAGGGFQEPEAPPQRRHLVADCGRRDWSVLVDNCTFTMNVAQLEYGGALYMDASARGHVVINNSLIQENIAKQHGGGAFIAAESGWCNNRIEVNRTRVLQNSAAFDGAGGIYMLLGPGAQGSMFEVVLAANKAATSGGAVIYDVRTGGALEIMNVHAQGNSATEGGAVQLLTQYNGTALFFNCSFKDNTATVNGGAFQVVGNCSSVVNITSSFLQHNQAGNSGGAIHVTYGAQLVSSTAASSPFGLPLATIHTDTQLCLDNSSADFTWLQLTDNTAGNVGGALHASMNSSVTLANITMRNNAAGQAGGSVAAVDCTFLKLSASSITDSYANQLGGGLYVENCQRLYLSHVLAARNKAGQAGGGLAVAGRSLGQPIGTVNSSSTSNTFTSMFLDGVAFVNNSVATVVSTADQCMTANSSSAVPNCTNQTAWQLNPYGLGGGVHISGSVVGVLSKCHLSEGNMAAFGTALASTQQCYPTENAHILTHEVSDPWKLLNWMAARKCWLLQLSNTLLPSLPQDAAVANSSSSLMTSDFSIPLAMGIPLWVEDLVASALFVNCSENIKDMTLANNYVGQAVLDSSEARVLYSLNYSTSLIGDLVQLSGESLNQRSIDKRYTMLLKSLKACMKVLSTRARMRQFPYLGQPPTYMALDLETEEGIVNVDSAKPIQLHTGISFNASVRLYDIFGQHLPLDQAPSRITLGLKPIAGGNATWLDDNIAKLDPGLDKSLTVPVRYGTANWSKIIVHGWPGTYDLSVTLENNKVPPLQHRTILQRCYAGETLILPDDGKENLASWTRCRSCSSSTYGLWVDSRPDLSSFSSSIGSQLQDINASSYEQAELSACQVCPGNARCPGGAVVVPLPGYWHSAPNSTRMHKCPNTKACGQGVINPSDGYWSYLNEANENAIRLDSRSEDLITCQQEWYKDSRSLGQTSSILISSYEDYISIDNNTGMTSSTTMNHTALADCVLWGLESDNPDSYMQHQCMPGYTGNLCAACTPGYYIDSSFTCKSCPSLAHTIGLGLASFFGSVALVLFTAYTNFSEGFGEQSGNTEEKLESQKLASKTAIMDGEKDHGNGAASGEEAQVELGDVLKVFVTHIQYLVIITRLSVDYPGVILRAQALFSAVTGAETYVTYSPSCLLPALESDGQSSVQLLAGILTPCAVVLVSMLIWACRYAYPRRKAFMKVILRATHQIQWDIMKQASKSGPLKRHISDSDMAKAEGNPPPTEGNHVGVSMGFASQLSFPAQNHADMGFRSVFGDVQVVSLDGVTPVSRSPSLESHVQTCPGFASQPGPPEVDFQGLDMDNAACASGAPLVSTRLHGDASQPFAHIWDITTIEDNDGHLEDGSAAVDTETGSRLRGQSISSKNLGRLPLSLSNQGRLNITHGPSARGLSAAANWHRQTPRRLTQQVGSSAIETLKKVSSLMQTTSVITLQNLDKALGLWQQLGVLLMAAVFILYPSWAHAALSTFACYRIDDGQGLFPEAQQATWHFGYWVRNMKQQCYSGVHMQVFVPIGVVSVLVFCLLPPVMSLWFVLTRIKGHQDNPHVRKAYGFLYRRYKSRFIWWETVLQLETFFLVAVEVLGRGLQVTYQALLLLAMFTLIAVINMSCAPLLSRALVLMEFLSLTTLSLTITLSLYFAVEGILQPVAENILAAIIISINTCLLVSFVYIAGKPYWRALHRKLEPSFRNILQSPPYSNSGHFTTDRTLDACTSTQPPSKDTIKDADTVDVINMLDSPGPQTAASKRLPKTPVSTPVFDMPTAGQQDCSGSCKYHDGKMRSGSSPTSIAQDANKSTSSTGSNVCILLDV